MPRSAAPVVFSVVNNKKNKLGGTPLVATGDGPNGPGPCIFPVLYRDPDLDCTLLLRHENERPVTLATALRRAYTASLRKSGTASCSTR